MTPLLTDGAAAAPMIPSIALDALLAQRDAAVAQLSLIAKAVAEYGAIAEVIWPPAKGEPRHHAPWTYNEPLNQRPSGRGEYLTSDRWLEESTKAVDSALWDHLLEESGLRTFLDAEARQEWQKQIDERKTPPLTKENIAATFASMHARRREFFERGVIRVFRELSWHYKTNRPQAFGKRIIIRGLVDADGRPGSYSRVDKLDDLDRVLHVMDGKPEPDHRSSLSARLRQRREPRHAPIESTYLRIKTFKIGTGHIEFRRLDLVDELNRILAKHFPDALPPQQEDGEPRPTAGEGLATIRP
jgi:hypothetical protein